MGVLDRFNEYPQLSSRGKLLSLYRELGDNDIQLIKHLFKELKLHGLDNKNDISKIVRQGEKIKNIDNDINEIANIIGRLNFTKMRLEGDVDDLVKRIDHCDSVLMEKYQKIHNNK